MARVRHEVFVADIDASRCIEIVRELRAQGLAQGIDFDFEFQRKTYDAVTYDETSRGAKFYFYQGKWATYFAIKYAN